MSQHSANCHPKEQTESYLPPAYPKDRSVIPSFILPTNTYSPNTYYGPDTMLGPGNLAMEQFHHGPCSCGVYSLGGEIERHSRTHYLFSNDAFDKCCKRLACGALRSSGKASLEKWSMGES